MARLYEQAKAPRFKIEPGPTGERIRVPARRKVFALAFLPIWLAGWTVGGILALNEFIETREPFLAMWLVAWGVGWVVAAGIVAWMIGGAEILRVSGGDLEIGHSLFGWTRSRFYRAADIRDLKAAEAAPFMDQFQLQLPMLMKAKWGSVKFNYGARTIYVAQGLDEAEGRLIADWLLKRLPLAAQTRDQLGGETSREQ